MTIAATENPVIMTLAEAEELVVRKQADFPHNTGTGRGLSIKRVFTKPGVHPYDEVTWEQRNVVMHNWRDGSVNFEQHDVEFPDSWSVNASQIVTTKYFRGKVGTADRETSLRQVIDRVVKTYRLAGEKNGYFATSEDAEIFEHELAYMLLHQIFAFNSPVWFNVGTKMPQQVSACFILSVNDSMDSILNWYREEGLIFKGGSGAGLNLSRLRSSKESLSSGGNASGPVSFMRGADASAGTIKSGGATRRAAKMVILDVNHPDINEFVQTKVREEEKIRVLRDAGFDMDLSGADISSVQYQNANNSVRVDDEFMRAVKADGEYELKARMTGEVVDTIKAQQLFRDIAKAAWACADPGIQYDSTIQKWHTCPATGRITGSNPCSEYMHLDNSSCNLASLRLTKFEREDGTFDAEKFVKAVEIVITAMDISICFADFPTQAITDVTHRYRQLGIGYADLGALLMRRGLAYDSEEGQALAAAITSLMTAVSYRRSAELAGEVGPYQGYADNALDHQGVMARHAQASQGISHTSKDQTHILRLAADEWEMGNMLGREVGWRNAQASLLAPTGTIGFMMDCDTTGVEPDFSLVKTKKLVGGGSMVIVNQSVPQALKALGYDAKVIEEVEAYVAEHGHVEGAPGLAAEHYSVFDCAVGERAISPMGHVRMMAAVQPFLSGAISKTVNMPESATVEEVEEIYFEGWKLGLKALAIYRDNCKVGQPLSNSKTTKKVAEEVRTMVVDEAGNHLTVVQESDEQGRVVVSVGPVRRKLPKQRPSLTTSFTVGGAEGYLTAGKYEDGSPGEIFVRLGKQGSTLAGVMDAFSMSISVGLQYGIPLEFYVGKFKNLRFEPAGMTDDPDIRMATSIVDYLFRRLALNHLAVGERLLLGVQTADERSAEVEAGYGEGSSATALDDVRQGVETHESAAIPGSGDVSSDMAEVAHNTAELVQVKFGIGADAPLCMTCGTKMRPAGSCYACEGCGATSGCS